MTARWRRGDLEAAGSDAAFMLSVAESIADYIEHDDGPHTVDGFGEWLPRRHAAARERERHRARQARYRAKRAVSGDADERHGDASDRHLSVTGDGEERHASVTGDGDSVTRDGAERHGDASERHAVASSRLSFAPNLSLRERERLGGAHARAVELDDDELLAQTPSPPSEAAAVSATAASSATSSSLTDSGEPAALDLIAAAGMLNGSRLDDIRDDAHADVVGRAPAKRARRHAVGDDDEPTEKASKAIRYNTPPAIGDVRDGLVRCDRCDGAAWLPAPPEQQAGSGAFVKCWKCGGKGSFDSDRPNTYGSATGPAPAGPFPLSADQRELHERPKPGAVVELLDDAPPLVDEDEPF